MSSKSFLPKVAKYAMMIIMFVLGVLGFSQKIPMTTVIPITITIFFLGIVAEALEMYFKKSNNRIEKILYFIRLGLIGFCLSVIIITVIVGLKTGDGFMS